MPSVSSHQTRCAVCSAHTSLLAAGAECCFSYLGLCPVRLVSVPRLSVRLVAFSVARRLRGEGGGCWIVWVLKMSASASKFLVPLRARSFFCPFDPLLPFVSGLFINQYFSSYFYFMYHWFTSYFFLLFRGFYAVDIHIQI